MKAKERAKARRDENHIEVSQPCTQSGEIYGGVTVSCMQDRAAVRQIEMVLSFGLQY